MARPAELPRWADVGGDIETPSSGKQDIGWLVNERPPAQYFNWLANTTYLWTQYLDDRALEVLSLTSDEGLDVTADGAVEFFHGPLGEEYETRFPGADDPYWAFENVDDTNTFNIRVGSTQTQLLNTVAGKFIQIGNGTSTSHSLDNVNDLLVSGELEVDGAAFFDGAVTVAGALSGAAVYGTSLGITSLFDITSDGTKTTLLPAVADYLRVGDAGTTSHTLNTNDDLLVSGRLEVDGASFLDGALDVAGITTLAGGIVLTGSLTSGAFFPDNATLKFGNTFAAPDATMYWDTGELVLAVGNTPGTENFSITTNRLTVSDGTTNFIINPEADSISLFSGSSTKFIRIGSDAPTASTHSLDSNRDLFVTGELEVDGTAFFDGTATFAGTITAAAINGTTIRGTTVGLASSLLDISSDGTKVSFVPATGDYTLFGDAGTTSHTLNTNDDVVVSGRLEVDGIIYADNTTANGGVVWTNGAATASLYHNGSTFVLSTSAHNILFSPGSGAIVLGDDYRFAFGDAGDSSLRHSTVQTVDNLVLGVGVEGNALIMCQQADVGFDFAHADATDPTLFIHSRNQSTTEWISFKHDGTNGLIDVGTGTIKLLDMLQLSSTYAAGITVATGTVQIKDATGTTYNVLCVAA